MTTTASLFADTAEEILPGFWLLRSLAEPAALAPLIDTICAAAPPRHMRTPRGFTMSVAMTGCGDVGWVSDRRGYRYAEHDPVTGNAWPPMPGAFVSLAAEAARRAGFAPFLPDACLLNRYEPGTRMGTHRDADEVDYAAPIVSVSLGIPARFYMVGPERRGRSTSVDLASGDVVVFGGPARRHFHGVRELKPATDSLFGATRWNLTFRKAL